MSASELPDELWRRILEIGIELSNLSYRDLCCLSITCRRLNRISGEDFLWYSLLHSDFPQRQHDDPSSSSTSSKTKSLYKIRFERDRERKRLAHRRTVLRMESEVAEHRRKIQELELQSAGEKEKMKRAVVELSNLRRVRQASVALNVWQPDVIRGRQKQVVEQCNVPVDIRINSIEMELKLCRQQIEGFDKALRVEKQRLEAAKEKLASVKYHPLQENNLALSPLGTGRKKLKSSSNQLPCSEARTAGLVKINKVCLCKITDTSTTQLCKSSESCPCLNDDCSEDIREGLFSAAT